MGETKEYGALDGRVVRRTDPDADARPHSWLRLQPPEYMRQDGFREIWDIWAATPHHCHHQLPSGPTQPLHEH
eukprot:9520322-Karenia_brevis.AAC.1